MIRFSFRKNPLEAGKAHSLMGGPHKVLPPYEGIYGISISFSQ